MSKDSPLELAQCVDVNLDNLGEQVAGLPNHPFFQIVKLQVAALIKQLQEAS